MDSFNFLTPEYNDWPKKSQAQGRGAVAIVRYR